MKNQAMSLFDESWGNVVSIGEGAYLLRGFAIPFMERLLPDLWAIVSVAPFTHMVTPGGFRMSAAMTNCGELGWISDRTGYRYDRFNPSTETPWPELKLSFLQLAAAAAKEAGYDNYVPDSCLINRYEPGSRLTLHQDRNEVDFSEPIVSVSVGIPATFIFGGLTRSSKTRRIALTHGDVVVWGGVSRLVYHGVSQVKPDHHPVTGGCRINLTFRKAG